MYNFTTTIKKGANFTPSSLIYRHGKEKHLQVINCYGSQCLLIDGKLYGYHSYMIETQGNMEKITVQMILK